MGGTLLVAKKWEEWWVEGENNKKNFHSRTIARRRRQVVHQLKMGDGM